MSTYISYKFSEYLRSEIPADWLEMQLGFLAQQTRNAFVDGPFGSDLKSDDYVDAGIPLIQLNNIRDNKHVIQNMKFISEIKKKQLSRHVAIPGDVVIAKMADPVARAAIVCDSYKEYVIVADCVKMTSNKSFSNLRYLVWAINCDSVRINAELVSTGTTRVRISLNDLKKLKIPYPSIQEQVSIAAFLDHETAKIDTLIEKQNQLIELLKEKRQAVISHAVTKGLNPDALMKDSGVEWLGEVPEHWDISNLGYNTFKIGSGKTPRGGADIYQDSGILFLRSQNVHGNGLRVNISECVYINKLIHSEMYSTRVIPGDILLNITGGSIGRSCLVPDDFIESNVNQHVCILRLPDYLRVFLSFFIKSDAIQNQIDALQTGGNREGLNFEQISKLRICLPSCEEIIVINEYVKEKLFIFEQSELLTVSMISLLKERRTALISAAVTGKIDVRNWRAPQVVSESKMPEATA